MIFNVISADRLFQNSPQVHLKSFVLLNSYIQRYASRQHKCCWFFFLENKHCQIVRIHVLSFYLLYIYVFFNCEFMALKISDIYYCFSQMFFTYFFFVEEKRKFGTHIRYKKLSQMLCTPVYWPHGFKDECLYLFHPCPCDHMTPACGQFRPQWNDWQDLRRWLHTKIKGAGLQI